MQHASVSRAVIAAAIRVHTILGSGFVETVYRNALACELRARGLDVDAERRLQVLYGDLVVGEFVADLVVVDALIVELKAVSVLVHAQEAQLINYLAATGIDVGLLINFGAARLEVRRRTRDIAMRRISKSTNGVTG